MAVAVGFSQEEMVSLVLDVAAFASLQQVAEGIGVAEDDLEAMLSGERRWPDGAQRVVEQMAGILSIRSDEGGAGALASAGGPASVTTDETLGDWRGTPQAKAADAKAANLAAEGISHGESLAQRAKGELYRYLEVIVRRQFDPRMTEEQALAMLAYRLELELLIIVYWRDTVPVPGRNWDDVRRIHEADERTGRLNRVRDHQRRAERFFTKLRRWSGRGGVSEELVRSIAREAAFMEHPLETDDDIDFIFGRSEFGRILQGTG